MAVKTTEIYCIASCQAKFPNEHNIEFYPTRKEAEQAGYRGCYRCHAATIQLQPPWVTTIVTYLHNNLYTRVSMTDLEQQTNRHRSTITSWFTDIYGMTPLSYLRQLKMEAAKRQISRGEDYRDVAFSLGYTSVSGFRSAFKSHFQQTPGAIQEAVQ